MHKRAINSRAVKPVWREDNHDDTPDEPLGPLLEALGPVVYAVHAGDGLVKIGHTSNLARRARQVGSGFRSILAWAPGTRQDEAAIHRRLSGRAVRGSEWYPADDVEVLRVVNEMRQALNVRAITTLSA